MQSEFWSNDIFKVSIGESLSSFFGKNYNKWSEVRLHAHVMRKIYQKFNFFSIATVININIKVPNFEFQSQR